MTNSIKSRLVERGPGTRKLDEAKVRRIKELLGANHSLNELADRFSVSPTTISSIKSGKTWGWV